MPQDPEALYPPPLGANPPPPPAPPEDEGLRRFSPQQVLLAAGAVAVVVAGAASLGSGGWLLPSALAVVAAAASLGCGREGLRASQETLALVTLALAVTPLRNQPATTAATVLAALTAAFWVLGRLQQSTVGWPVAAWLTAQLAVLSSFAGTEWTQVPHVAAVLGTAVAGLLVALRGRRTVAVVALASATPWWLAGVGQGTHLVWTTTSPATAAVVAVLMVAVAGALLALPRRPVLRPWLGPRPAVPVLAGAVVGSAVAGVLQSTGPAGVPAAGYLGLVTASLVAELASPQPHSLARPAGLAMASTATALAVVHLLHDGRWTALALLLLTAAVPAGLVAARQPADRPAALPVAVGCLTGATVLAEAGGSLGPGSAGPLLLVVAVLALATATLERHEQSEVPVAVSAVVVGLLAVGHVARSAELAAVGAALAVLGAALVGYASRTGRAPARAGGCAALALAVWLVAADAGVQVPEAYTLALAGVLALYSGRRLASGPSWPAWGPALAAGYGPSALLAVVEPDLLRVVLVVAGATVTMITAAGRAVQAPLVVGGVVLSVVALGRLVAVLPGPALVVLIAAGAALLAVGASYESRRRQARAAVATLADMR